MRYFPLFLDLAGQRALVVGDGEVAARKAAALAAAGACVEVISERPEPVLLEAVEARGMAADAAHDAAADGRALAQPQGGIRLLARAFRPEDVIGRALVVSASGDARRDTQVSDAARRHGVPVNVVDRPHLCSFIWPAIVDRDPITVAVCSAGTAPVLARSIRARIEAMLPSNLGRLARFADGFRAAVKATRADGTSRRRFWERFFESPVAETVLAGDEQRAREQMLALINRREDAAETEGRVTLVGAGPGDPELLTLKALRALQEADVIVHDRLVGPRILEYARRDAERIDAGKAPGRHPMTQDAINRLLAEHARAGRRVVRLKGGDPFVFGRGGEERSYLRSHGIRCDIVPGITAATGCAAEAGIPLSLRGVSQALTVVTARGRDGAEPDLDWRAMARDRQTLAIYMGASAAPGIARRLIEAGRNPATPVAVVARGTLPDRRQALGTLDALPRLVRGVGSGPVLILIGEVVREADAWGEQQPALAVAR
jgi:uroporphyrin-III C-methyltransferase/precorrin-2 dehydrogenase/sirohydrochlorin ferrochelatase